MKSHTVLLHPTWDVNHPFVQRMLPISLLVADLVAVSVSQCYVQVTLILLNKWPQSTRSASV